MSCPATDELGVFLAMGPRRAPSELATASRFGGMLSNLSGRAADNLAIAPSHCGAESSHPHLCARPGGLQLRKKRKKKRKTKKKKKKKKKKKDKTKTKIKRP